MVINVRSSWFIKNGIFLFECVNLPFHLQVDSFINRCKLVTTTLLFWNSRVATRRHQRNWRTGYRPAENECYSDVYYSGHKCPYETKNQHISFIFLRSLSVEFISLKMWTVCRNLNIKLYVRGTPVTHYLFHVVRA